MEDLSDERKCRISGLELENFSICLVWPRVMSGVPSLHRAFLYVAECTLVQVASQTVNTIVVHLNES